MMRYTFWVAILTLWGTAITGVAGRQILNTTLAGKTRPVRRIPPPRIFRTNSTADDETVNAWINSVISESSNRRKLGYDMRSIRKWVNGHNDEREKHYRNGALEWDKKIARFAKQHATYVGKGHNCSPQFNEDNVDYGENLYWAVFEHGQDPWTISECVQEWIGQGKNYDYGANTCEDGEDCAAYLQVVWKESKLIGCGEVRCPYHGDFKGVAQFFICNYSPAAAISEDHPRPW